MKKILNIMALAAIAAPTAAIAANGDPVPTPKVIATEGFVRGGIQAVRGEMATGLAGKADAGAVTTLTTSVGTLGGRVEDLETAIGGLDLNGKQDAIVGGQANAGNVMVATETGWEWGSLNTTADAWSELP
ncbi:MAG: hypothetical protein LBL46_03740 [Rickettsiales bacterium]|jgi:hypothetical protein|nr:hypothetical protein [Rickettsiales bacterium]